MKHRIKVDEGGLRLPNICLMCKPLQKSSASQNNSKMKMTMSTDWHTPEKNKGYPLGSKQDKDPVMPCHVKMEDTIYFAISAVDLDTNPQNVIPLITNAPLRTKADAWSVQSTQDITLVITSVKTAHMEGVIMTSCCPGSASSHFATKLPKTLTKEIACIVATHCLL